MAGLVFRGKVTFNVINLNKWRDSMILKFFLPIIVGVSIVLQGTLNRNSATHIGLASAVFLNAVVFLFFSAGFWALIKFNIISGNAIASINPFTDFHWWQILPGCFGFLIVFLVPLAIEYLGANLTFAAIICTQLLVSMIWDFWAHKTTPTLMSLVGVAIMIAGLAVLMLGKK